MSTLHNGTPSQNELVVIGRVKGLRDRIRLQIDERYRAAIEGLDGFSHAIVLWWFDKFDTEESRSTLTMTPPFEAPELGVFALKAPMRPNPIGMSVVRLLDVDVESGTIGVPRIDAFDDTPILDIKPYMPAFDRVEGAEVPEWASSWRESMPTDGVALEPPPGE
jgi:tRNA-Thr(GGU) m(6)t(6)A37 methyltransferase TsaA